MLLMGVGLVGGAVAAQFGASLAGLDQQIGTNGSAAAAVLGIGLMVAALYPSSSVAWVRAGILYGVVVVAFEVVSSMHGKGFHLGPVIFGLAFTLLLIAAYPERKRLIGDMASARPAPLNDAPQVDDGKPEVEVAKPKPEAERAS
jgi:peptidoglycan/LPS O-acetylase OafA/YrhL